MLKGIDDVRATGCNIIVPLFLIILAQVYWTAGQPEEGFKRLVEAAKLVETTGERWAAPKICLAAKTAPTVIFMRMRAFLGRDGSAGSCWPTIMAIRKSTNW
jgi:hypothetical protein